MQNFIESKVSSESARKAYATLFKRIEEQEKYINKKVDKWNKEDCINLLSNIGSTKYNTILTKWSLFKKYLIYLENKVYLDITNEDLMNIGNSSLRYISFDELKERVGTFENYIDQALLLLIRSGVKGEGFSELSSLKRKDIKGNVIHLKDRDVEINDYVADVVKKAMNEKGYKMDVREAIEQGRRIAYDYYGYNKDSEYFWRNRRSVINNDGLDAMRPNASKIKINKLISKLNDNTISSTSLTMSYVVDEILKVEDMLNIIFTEGQTFNFIEKLGVKVSMYSVYNCKKNLRKERGF